MDTTTTIDKPTSFVSANAEEQTPVEAVNDSATAGLSGGSMSEGAEEPKNDSCNGEVETPSSEAVVNEGQSGDSNDKVAETEVNGNQSGDSNDNGAKAKDDGENPADVATASATTANNKVAKSKTKKGKAADRPKVEKKSKGETKDNAPFIMPITKSEMLAFLDKYDGPEACRNVKECITIARKMVGNQPEGAIDAKKMLARLDQWAVGAHESKLVNIEIARVIIGRMEAEKRKAEEGMPPAKKRVRKSKKVGGEGVDGA